METEFYDFQFFKERSFQDYDHINFPGKLNNYIEIPPKIPLTLSNSQFSHLDFPLHSQFSNILRLLSECTPHLDRVSLNLYGIPTPSLFNTLISFGFKSIRDIRLNSPSSYRRLREFSCYGSRLSISYKPESNYLPPIRATIQDPSYDLLFFIHNILQSHSHLTHGKPSQIELALDFPFSDDLQRFFLDHLFLKYHKKRCRFIKSKEEEGFTYYIEDTRGQAKAVRMYRKQVNTLRLELVLNRPFIKRLGLKLPLDTLSQLPFSTIFCFKELNLEKLSNYKATDRFGRRINLAGRINLEDIDWPVQGRPLMDQVARIKKYSKHPERFFEDMEECSEAFYKLIRSKL